MSQRIKTFEVLDWVGLPDGMGQSKDYDLECECGREAVCPVANCGVLVMGRNRMTLYYDPETPPPSYWMPNRIRCRKCGRVYEHEKGVA